MKVLAAVIVAPHAKISGAVTAAKEISAALRAHCDISLAVMASHDGCANYAGLPVRLIRGTLPFDRITSRLPNKYKVPFYRSTLPALVRTGNYDLVHIHNPLPAFEMLRVARSATETGTPFVISTHGFVELSGGGREQSLGALERVAFRYLIRNPIRNVVRNASGILVFSPADVPIVEEFGAASIPIEVAPNGVHSPSPKSSQRLADLKAQYSLENSTPVILYLGSHAPNKGLPILLEAVLASRHNFILLVGGEKRPHIDYEGILCRLKPGQRIIFLGYVADDAVHDFYDLADIFAFPSLADTFPLVVLEAMSHGLAIVASRVGGVPFQLSDDCGLLVAPGNAAALTSSIDSLIVDLKLRARLGERATRKAQAKFSWAGAAKAAYRLYDAVLEAKSRRF